MATPFKSLTEKNTEYKVTFDGSSLPDGVYIYRLTTGKETVTEKFMIAR